MTYLNSVKAGLKATRTWRDLIIARCKENGLNDLSYRPSTGMSAFGWILAHQAAVFDYSLNVLIKQGPLANSEMFESYRPGTDGSWLETDIDQIQTYYNEGESSLLEWVESASENDLERVIEEGSAPKFFVGMSIRDVIANMFSHLSYHTGQLESLRRDWINSRES